MSNRRRKRDEWKTDSLYRLLQDNSHFEPFIVLGMTPGRTNFYSEEKIEHRFQHQKKYFTSKGMTVKIGYDIKRHCHIPLKSFKPDIVFTNNTLESAKKIV